MKTTGIFGVIKDQDGESLGGFFKWRLRKGKQTTCMSSIFWLHDIPSDNFTVQLYTDDNGEIHYYQGDARITEIPSDKAFNELHRGNLTLALNGLGYYKKGEIR